MESKNYTLILPVLFLEYLAISVARTLFPGMIVNQFGGYSYLVVGLSETVKGLLAFISCPLFGKSSDKIGRKACLLITMVGSTLPVLVMAFTSNMIVYVTVVAISGLFSATFSLTFAYISDCLEPKKRAPAYGLALATFGMSFTVGPLLGSILSDFFGNQFVFMFSGLLVVCNIIYILFFLPETIDIEEVRTSELAPLCMLDLIFFILEKYY